MNCRSLLIAFGLDLESTRYCDCKTSEAVDNRLFLFPFSPEECFQVSTG